MVRIAVLVSGGGTNLQALIDAQSRGELKNGRIAAVLSSRPDAYALERAARAGIPGYVVARKDFASNREMTIALVDKLRELNIGLVVLAGFLHILTGEMVAAFPNAILNVHPALIPSFCGAGYYGLHVHEAALAYGVKLTGATVHFVNEEPDGGPIVLQKAVEILEGDTPEVLQRRVMEQAEWHILPQAVSLFCEGRLRVEGRIVHILLFHRRYGDMSDLRLLAFVLSGGFLFLGGIWLGGDYGLALLLLGLVVLLVPVVLACISLLRWLVPPSQSSHE